MYILLGITIVHLEAFSTFRRSDEAISISFQNLLEETVEVYDVRWEHSWH
jgi:hypothetical protein